MHNRIQHMPQSRCSFVMLPDDADEALLDGFISTLADDIINRYEKPLLWKTLWRNTEDMKPFQIREMLALLPELDGDAAVGTKNRHFAVRHDLGMYFSENDSANVEGLVHFRLKTYHRLLEQTAENLIDLYFAKREYEEFISLLRYFVEVQNGRPHLAHLLVHENGRYSLLNEEKEDITALCLADFIPVSEMVSDNMDDLLISILITLAPERLVIHGRGNIANSELFATIERVFDKTEYCMECELCDQTNKT